MKMFKKLYMILAICMALACFAQGVEAAKDINIQEALVSVNGIPGATASGSFHVINNGTENLNVVFTSTSVVLGARSFAGPAISPITGIAPGAVPLVNFGVSIPSGQFAGTYVGSITAADGTVTKTVPLNVIVNAVPAVTAAPAAITGTISQGLSAAKTLTITNTGNSNIANIVVSATDLTSGSNTIANSHISISQNGFALAYGAAAKVLTLTISVPADAAVGTYSGKYSVVADTANEVNGTIQVVVSQPNPHLTVPTEIKKLDVVRTRDYSEIFTITNDGDYDLAGFVLKSTAASKYEVAFTSVPTTLAKGASDQITVSFTIPDDENSGEHSIGDIKVESDRYNASFPLKISTKKMLNLKDLRIYVDGKKNSVDETGGDRVKIKPESKVEVKATIENLYSDNDDIDFDNVVMTATILGIDDGDDLEEESDEVTVKSDDTEELIATFNIPLEVDEDTFDLDISIEGDDDNGANEQIDISMEVSVEKETHELRIQQFALAQDTLQCDLTPEFDVQIANTGTKDEDEVKYTIKCSGLGIDIAEGGPGRYIELDSNAFDEDSKFSKTHSITLPSTTRAGSYVCEMQLFNSGTDLQSSKTATLKVEKCVEDTPVVEPKDEEDDVQIIVPPTTPTTVPVLGPVVAEDDNSMLFGINEWLIIGLLGAIFLIALIIVIILAMR